MEVVDLEGDAFAGPPDFPSYREAPFARLISDSMPDDDEDGTSFFMALFLGGPSAFFLGVAGFGFSDIERAIVRGGCSKSA